MNATMTERFNVAGALLVKLFGRPDAEDARSPTAPPGCATSASPGHVRPGVLRRATLVASLAQALAYGLGGCSRSPARRITGTVVTLALLLTRLYGPLTALSNVRVDVMSALVTFERVFEVLDLAPDGRDAPERPSCPPDARSIEFGDVHFRYPTRRRGLARVAGRRRRARHRTGARGAARRLVPR